MVGPCEIKVAGGKSSGIGRLSAHPFLAFAHLALCAAAILARPSALIFLRGGLVGVAVELTGRPRFAGVVCPFSRTLACSRRAISASIVSIISAVSMRLL
jgi:hypothetical protein